MRASIMESRLAVTCLFLLAIVASVRALPARPEVKLSEVYNASKPEFKLEYPAFHFRPAVNWMNDPNGPFYLNGLYHLFFQWDPYSAVWGNITWGHAISTDLLNWTFLPIALKATEPYDAEGCWSGSATMINGIPYLMYTSVDAVGIQTQSLATPANLSDPYLTEWTKSSQNPLIRPPQGVNGSNFRDPTTAWQAEDGTWRMLLGAKKNGVDAALVYRSPDFFTWTVNEQPMRTAPLRTAMWECPDFYPVHPYAHPAVPLEGSAEDLYVLKASFDDTRNDFYSVGTYDPSSDTFTPLDPALDVQTGLQYDYGERFYASKTFFDPAQDRRILFGWVNESDAVYDDLAKGWAGVMSLPRQVWVDHTSKTHLIQLPIREVENLRGSEVAVLNTTLKGGETVPLGEKVGVQADIEIAFKVPTLTAAESDASSSLLSSGKLSAGSCSSLGAAQRGVVGPFGVSVLKTPYGVEETAIYFEMIALSSGENAQWTTRVCSDLTRSSLIAGVEEGVYGDPLTIFPGEEDITLRIIVDHSFIEVFAHGGRSVITSRVYPTFENAEDAQVLLFNNGTVPVKVKRAKAWKMQSLRFAHVE